MRRLALVLALGLAVVAAGCGSSGGGADRPTRRVTVVLDWTPNTNHSGVYLAKANGAYARAGLDVEVIEPGPAGGLAPLAAGKAQFGFSYAEQVLPARADGTPVVSIATVLTTNTSSLMAPTDRGIRRPRDLAGKTYGTFGGPIEEPLIKALVACDGGDPKSVKFVEVGNADYNVGFRKRAYDTVWVFDGWDVIRLRDLAKTPITTIPFRDHLDCIPDWYTPVIATTETTIRDDPDLVRRFLQATSEGYQEAIRDPQAASDALMDAAPESDRALVEASARYLVPYYAKDPSQWGRQDPAIWRRFGAFLESKGLDGGGVDTDKAFTNEFLPLTR